MSDSTPAPENSSPEEIGEALKAHQSFILMSHIRPDADAIGSQIALGESLRAMGKTVRLVNEDGLPENLEFLPGSEHIESPPSEALEVEVAIALDTATKPRLGDKALHAASKAKLWLNIDHHKSNTSYGDLNLIVPTSPATGEILYDLITGLNLPLPDATRDSIYVAVSTDTGSFQYPSTTVHTYEMAADLIRRGVNVGEINAKTYDDQPYRKLELMRALLNTLERSEDGLVANWMMHDKVRVQYDLKPEDSEGLIDIIRAIKGVQVAAFFEELPDHRVRVSLRSKNKRFDVCQVAQEFGGGGHALAAGIRMPGPIEDAKAKVLASIDKKLKKSGICS